VSERQQGSYRRSRFTPDHVRLLNLLSEARIIFQAEDVPFVREGELTKDGKVKTYSPDVVINDQKVIIEVIGKGSSSLDPERKKFFRTMGWYELDLPNRMVRDYPEQTLELVKNTLTMRALQKVLRHPNFS
jgi:hypothetical protein